LIKSCELLELIDPVPRYTSPRLWFDHRLIVVLSTALYCIYHFIDYRDLAKPLARHCWELGEMLRKEDKRIRCKNQADRRFVALWFCGWSDTSQKSSLWDGVFLSTRW